MKSVGKSLRVEHIITLSVSLTENTIFLQSG